MIHTHDVQGRPWQPCPQCPRRLENGGDGSECSCPSRRHRAYCDHVQADPATWTSRIQAQPAENRPARRVPGPPPAPHWPRPDGRLRVGFAGPCYYDLGGTEVWHQTLLPRLGAVQVVGYAVEHSGQNPGPLPCPLGTGRPAMESLARAVDVLIVWGLGAELGELLPQHNRPRIIWTSHGDGIWTQERAAAAAPYVDRWAAVSRRATRWLPDPAATAVIPNTVDPARVQTDRDRGEIRRALGLLEADRVVLYLGRLSREKRPQLIAQAIARHLPPPWLCVVAGDGAERPRLEGLDRVRLLGVRADVAELLAAADCLAVPSEEEGFCLAATEAWAASLPVVATPVGVIADRPDLARIVPLDAGPAQWAAALEADHADEPGRRARVARAFEAVATTFGLAAHVEAWERLILETAPPPPPPTAVSPQLEASPLTAAAREAIRSCPHAGPTPPRFGHSCACDRLCNHDPDRPRVVAFRTCAECPARPPSKP